MRSAPEDGKGEADKEFLADCHYLNWDDERIKAIVQEGLSVYHVDAPQLEALRPDLIITQVQCEVCAVSERVPREYIG